MIDLIRKFIKPRMMVREKILATKIGIGVLLEDMNLMQYEREALEEASDVLALLLAQYDGLSRHLVRDDS